MVDDPDGKENDDKDDGYSGYKYAEVPKAFAFFPDVDEKNKLNEGLKESKAKQDDESNLRVKIKIGWIDNNKIGCEG